DALGDQGGRPGADLRLFPHRRGTARFRLGAESGAGGRAHLDALLRRGERWQEGYPESMRARVALTSRTTRHAGPTMPPVGAPLPEALAQSAGDYARLRRAIAELPAGFFACPSVPRFA